MARIIYCSYVVRYPLGGIFSWMIHYLLGLKELGHEVYFVEKWGYPDSCFDPSKNVMSDDCTYGVAKTRDFFERFDLGDKWCFVERNGTYHGLGKSKIDEIFRTADLVIDHGAHGSWFEESQHAGLTVLIDGEPGNTQLKMSNKKDAGIKLIEYDRYFSHGMNVGKKGNPIPTLGISWGRLFHPVTTKLFPFSTPPEGAPYSTIMNWQSGVTTTYKGKLYGQKNIEFEKFKELPGLVKVKVELALAGNEAPVQELRNMGWSIRNPHKITESFDSFRQYLADSRGEFSFCKNVYVENNNGWFSDKSGAYLASGRPVVLQDTGFGQDLPTGEGLFAVKSAEEAAEAINEIEKDYPKHSGKAREIAKEYLEAKTVMGNFLKDLGI